MSKDNGKRIGQIRGREGVYAGSTIPVEGNLVIGRDSSICQLVLYDAGVSRKHCEITYDEEQNAYYVYDYSTNGIFRQDGSRIASGTKVSFHAGDIIKIGNDANTFEFLEPEARKDNTSGNKGGSGSGRKVPSTAALVIGILSLCLSVAGAYPFGIFATIAGFVLGIVGLILGIKVKKLTDGETGNAAFVCALLGLIFGVIMSFGCVFCTCGVGSFGCVGGGCIGAETAQGLYDILDY